MFLQTDPPQGAGEVPTSETVPAAQVAALCWRMRKRKVQVLLVTSRETKRWVLPKGWPMAGLAPEGAAAREAWEEAGVEGKVGTVPLGAFHYDKILRNLDTLVCAVVVFPLRVQSLKAKFPERNERRRKWMSAEEAAHAVAEVELRYILLQLAESPGLLSRAGGKQGKSAA